MSGCNLPKKFNVKIRSLGIKHDINRTFLCGKDLCIFGWSCISN